MTSRLSDVDCDLLEHIRRYRLGLTRFCWAAVQRKHTGVSRRDVKECLRTLQKVHGYLDLLPLFGKQRYYCLTERMSSDDDVGTDRAGRRPLSEEEKLGAYAMLGFCFGAGAGRAKLTTGDLREYFPDLVGSLNRSTDPARLQRYYLAGERLGYLRIDKGGRGRWDRIASYVDRDIARHHNQPGFCRLIADGYFEVTVVTATTHKARRLSQLFTERPVHEGVAVHCFVLPELLHFLAPPRIVRGQHIPQRGF